jgi:hypothetical protein
VQNYPITQTYAGPERYQNNNLSMNEQLRHLNEVYRTLSGECDET